MGVGKKKCRKFSRKGQNNFRNQFQNWLEFESKNREKHDLFFFPRPLIFSFFFFPPPHIGVTSKFTSSLQAARTANILAVILD